MLASVAEVLVGGGDVEFALLGRAASEGEGLVVGGVVDDDGDGLLAIGIGREHERGGCLEGRHLSLGRAYIDAVHAGTDEEAVVGRGPEHLGGLDGAVVLDTLLGRVLQGEETYGDILVERNGGPPLPCGGVGQCEVGVNDACHIESEIDAFGGRRWHGDFVVLLQDAVFRGPELGAHAIGGEVLVQTGAHVNEECGRIGCPIVVGGNAVVEVLEAEQAVGTVLVEHGADDVVGHAVVSVHLEEHLQFAQLGSDDARGETLGGDGLVEFGNHVVDVGLGGEGALLP